jgi:hypothetical protein
MVPQYFAAPDAALNSSINRGNALIKKLAALGVVVTGMEIHPVGSAPATTPMGALSIPDAQALGVGPDDLVHLLFDYAGSGGVRPEVAAVEHLISPATVGAVIAVFAGLFPSLSSSEAASRALAALATLVSMAAALQSIF